MIITDGQALMNEINGQAISPRFQHASRVNATASQMIHVTDLYATIVRLADRPPMHFRATWTRRISSNVVKESHSCPSARSSRQSSGPAAFQLRHR